MQHRIANVSGPVHPDRLYRELRALAIADVTHTYVWACMNESATSLRGHEVPYPVDIRLFCLGEVSCRARDLESSFIATNDFIYEAIVFCLQW